MARKLVTILSIFLLFQFGAGHPTFNKNTEELRDEDLLDAYVDLISDENLDVLKANNLDGLQWENDEYISSKTDENDDYNEYNEHSLDDHIENKDIHHIKKRESNETTPESENKEVEITQDEHQENVQDEHNPEEIEKHEEIAEEGIQPENQEEIGKEENVNEEETGDGANQQEKTDSEETPQEEKNLNEEQTGNGSNQQEETGNQEPQVEEGEPDKNEEEKIEEEKVQEVENKEEEEVADVKIEDGEEITENAEGENPQNKDSETPVSDNEEVNKDVPNEENHNEEVPNEETHNEENQTAENQNEENQTEENQMEEKHNEENPNEEIPKESLQNISPARSALNTHEDLTQDTEEVKILYIPEDITPGSQTPQTRIVGGTRVTNREDFAYQASFRVITGQHFCGASIIDDKNLLTAAHCVFDDNQNLLPAARLIIVAGDLNVLDPNEYTIVRTVQQISPHPQYNYKTFQNDIAILRVESLGDFTKYINSIELARTTPSVGTDCVVSGWGKTSYNGVSSPELRKVTVPIVSLANCLIGYYNGILDGMICAGLMEGGKDACQGDSGGPLVCDNKLAGIVSWGKDCALKNHPGVYTDVAYFYSWIRTQQGFRDIEGEMEPGIDSRKLGFVAQKREEFPYQASLRYRKPNTHFCGATIIDPTHLITSAHCVMNDTNVVDPESLEVVVGDINIFEEADSTEYRSVSNIFTHSDYNPNTFENDIAVIRVSESFGEWTQDIKPIDLAEISPEAYSSCVVSGWGSANSPITPSEFLRYTSIPIIENRTCSDKYTDAIKPGMLCAGFLEKGKDSCQGDAGGPLVCNDKFSGIVSWGHRCANEGLPGVYTDVAKYRSWINEQKARSSSSFLKNSTFVLVICFSILKVFNTV